MTFVTLTMIVSVPGSATAASEPGGTSGSVDARTHTEYLPGSEAVVAYGPTTTRHLASHSAVRTLRRYITLKHRKAQQHTRWLGRPEIRTHYRWKASTSRPYLRWLAARWERRAHRLWKVRLVTLRDFQVRPGSDAWRNAALEVQRVYPGSYSWLMSCSASEGGWGRFVFNSQGSGAAGWMQYMPGTFAGFSWRARLDAARRGFVVPASAASLFSPLGQALAGGWALRSGLRHHWAGSGC